MQVTQVTFRLTDLRAVAVADAIRDFDLTLRRAVALTLESEVERTDFDRRLDEPLDEASPRPWEFDVAARVEMPRPIPPSEGGLEIVEARPGSLDIVGHLYGVAVAAFASDPATAAANLATLVAVGKGIWNFLLPSKEGEAGEEEEEEDTPISIEAIPQLVDRAIRDERKIDLVMREETGLLRKTREVRLKIR